MRAPRETRVAQIDWTGVAGELDAHGGAPLAQLLSAEEAAELVAGYDCDARYRSTVDMERHRFGSGQYRYFDTPYPSIISELKELLYPRLLPIAVRWWEQLGRPAPWPPTLAEWLDQCHAAGQRRSTALILKYGAGDWNALHRDLYGDLVFPLQVVVNLTRPGVDHEGGEFLLMEQRPRAQSRGTAFTLPHLHGFAFTTSDRPVRGARGWSAAPVRHGVSSVRSGERLTLGLVFHDAT